MTDAERTRQAEVYGLALQAWQVALDAGDRDAAVAGVRALVSDLDAQQLRWLATCLAVESVRGMPQRRTPQRVRRWLTRMRLEVTWAGS